MSARLIWIAGLSVGVAGLLGCQHGPAEAAPADWPVEWKNRKLHNSVTALTYAHRSAAAREARRRVERVAADFEQDTGVVPIAPLILLTDRGDELLTDDPQDLIGLALHNESFKGQTQGQALDAEQRQEEIRATLEELDELGLPQDLTWKMMPLALPQDWLVSSGFDAQAVTDMPAVAWSSRALLKDCARRMMDAQLKEEGIGPIARLTLAPVLHWARSKAVKMLVITQDTALYARWLSGLENMTREQRTQAIESYLERRTGEEIGALGAELGGVVPSPGHGEH